MVGSIGGKKKKWIRKKPFYVKATAITELPMDAGMYMPPDPPGDRTGLWKGARPNNCVRVGGVLSMFFALVFLMALLISRSNDTSTANRMIFYTLGLILLLGCSISSLVAVKQRKPFGALGFMVAAAILTIVVLSFCIADAAVPECEDNVVYVVRCTPGEKQNPLQLVAFDLALIVLLLLFASAGFKLFWNLRTEEMMRAREIPKENEDVITHIDLDDDL